MSLLDERETRVPDAGPAASSRPVTDPKTLWRQARLPLIVAAVLLVTGLVGAAVQGSASGTDLDPTAYTPGGSRALATLLAQRGSPVTRVDSVPAAAGTTLVVPDSSLLGAAGLRQLLADARGTDVVVVVTDSASADTLRLSIADDQFSDDDADPHCGLAAAVAASDTHIGTAGFDEPAKTPGFTQTEACYPGADDRNPKLLVLQPVSGSGSLTFLSGSTFLRNDKLDSEGDAALALGLIDHARPVDWVQPGMAQAQESSDGGTPVTQLLPHRLKVAFWELVVALVLLALWRGRRLGPVVVERLPVTVRAVETVRGRARLYRGSHARDRAALALREAARARLAQRLGLGEATVPPALVEAVANRSGRRRDEVASLLYGLGAPGDDAALVGLSSDLDRLVTDALTQQTGQR